MTTSFPPRAARRVVELAVRAPSIHNTQPWRWRHTATGLELYADHRQQLVSTDPLGRNLVISCGAALHHALTAATSLGWEAAVERLPDGPGSSLLARASFRPGSTPATAAADLAAIEQRRTDRRRFTSWPVSEELLARLASAAERQGTRALPLTDVSRRFRAELLVARAADIQREDQHVMSEQRRWVDHGPRDGIPAEVLPATAALGTADGPTRFSGGALDDLGREIESSDGLIVLHSRADDVGSWLAAGEGLSALWLLATQQGLSVVPLSQVVEVEDTRRALAEQVLGAGDQPSIMLRTGWQAIGRRGLPRTSRRDVSEVLELRP